eukprot:2442057-Rhodomonas_salina.1
MRKERAGDGESGKREGGRKEEGGRERERRKEGGRGKEEEGGRERERGRKEGAREREEEGKREGGRERGQTRLCELPAGAETQTQNQHQGSTLAPPPQPPQPPSPAIRYSQTTRPAEIKHKKTQSQYNLYQECVFLCLISPRTCCSTHSCRINGRAALPRYKLYWNAGFSDLISRSLRCSA